MGGHGQAQLEQDGGGVAQAGGERVEVLAGQVAAGVGRARGGVRPSAGTGASCPSATRTSPTDTVGTPCRLRRSASSAAGSSAQPC